MHIRCASHTLSLIATTDVKKVGNRYKHLQNKPFGKATALWNASQRPKASEVIFKELGCSLKIPVVTRWNSLFDALSLLLKHRNNLNSCMTKLKLPVMTEIDFRIIEEYILILSPIATGLDYLQRENDSMYGNFLPTLIAIEQKLKSINKTELVHSQPLLEAVSKGFVNRFRDYLELHETKAVEFALVAAVTNPKYKLMWLKMKESLNNETVYY